MGKVLEIGRERLHEGPDSVDGGVRDRDLVVSTRGTTSRNCEGFRLRGPWRGPSGLTSALSRAVRTAARPAPERKFGNP